jgi:hypothetical protein
MTENEDIRQGYQPANCGGEHFMPVNHELTNIIKARVIRRFKESGGELVISFHDGSAMKIRDMETNSPPLAAGAQIKEVQRTHVEPSAPRYTVERLMDELRLMASWLGLSSLTIAPVATIIPPFTTRDDEAHLAVAELVPSQSATAFYE